LPSAETVSPPRDLEVDVTGGRIRGVREGSTIAWRGIPFAAPPVGRLRFRAPAPVVPWEGVRAAIDFGPVAPQAYKGQFKGVGPGVPSGEDCLTINVITEAASSSRDSRPVMVFIHGGGYSAGSSRDFSGQGEGFVRTGEVVYVSFNYRLGALGYLDLTRYSTPERPIDSNLGLRDQVAALEWVQANIGAFGGDPQNVTVFGESAGGNAVTTLMTTPASEGLFARAIAQSSPANAVYFPELTAKWAAEFVEVVRRQFHPEIPADELSADASSSAAVTTMLDATSATDLVTAALTIQQRTPDAYPGAFCLAPVVDRQFLPEHPIAAFRKGRAHPIPLIIGTNNREGSIFRGRIDILPRSATRIRSLIRMAPKASRAAMRAAYPGLPGARAAADFGGDYAFWYPSTRVADFHSRYAPVHSYRFDVAPRLLRLVGLDATHGVEMYALFDQLDVPLTRAMTALGGREQFSLAGQRMRDNWIRFAKQLDLDGDWPRYTEADRLTKIIGTTDGIESDPRSDRRLAWNEFLPLDGV
jgi:para-nitrobenzyl esterase